MTAQYLFSSAKRNTALAAIGGDTMGQIEVDLLKQVLVATVASGGGGGGAAAWGSITGTLSAQTDLQTALDAKLNLTGGTMTGQLILQNASATGAVNVSPTWNNAGTNFNLIYGRVTNTASGASSKLIDVGTVAGGRMFDVAVNGNTTWQYGVTLTDGGYWNLNSSGFNLGNTSVIFQLSIGNASFRSTLTGGAEDGTIEQISGTSAQRFRSYNTFTSATSYERAFLDWVTEAGVWRIGTEKGASGGSARGLKFSVDGVCKLEITTDGEVLFTPPTSNPGPGILWNAGGNPAIGT